MTKLLHNGKIEYSENPVAFLPIGRTIRTSNDITLYHTKIPHNKFGYTEVDIYELMAQYAGGFRIRSETIKFEQFVHIDYDYIRDIISRRINPGFVAKYERVKADNMVRDAMLHLGLVSPAADGVTNKEVVSLRDGDTFISLLEQLCETKIRTIPTHSFIDNDVAQLLDEVKKLTPNQALLAFWYKAPRYWKDFLLLNIASNLPHKHIILPSKMLTTHSGLIAKLTGLIGFTLIDTTPGGKLTVDKINELCNAGLTRGDKIIWAVSGFDGSSDKRREVLSLLASFSDGDKLFDLDEADYASWKDFRDMIESCLNGEGGNPIINVKTGSGYDKVLAGLKLGGLFDNINGYSVHYIESITTQQDLEKAKFVDQDRSVDHVLAKGEVFIEIDQNSCSFINSNFDTDTITGYSKAYSDGNSTWFTDLLSMFFKPELTLGVSNRFYLPNILNNCINDIIDKHEPYFKDKNTSKYTNRTIIGVQVNTQAQSNKAFNKFYNTLSQVTNWLIFDASDTKRRKIEKDVGDWLKKHKDDIISAGGFVIINPNWSMANRSFSQGLIDVTLELKDKTDGQANNRPLTGLDKDFNNGLTLDNREKIIGVSVHLPLSTETSTISQTYEDFLSEPGHSDDEHRRKALTPILNHWRFIKDNQFIMAEREHDSYIDVSKTLRSQTMSEVEFDWFDSNQSLVGGIKLLKKQKTSLLKTGKSGTYIDPKKGSTIMTTDSVDQDEKYRQAEAVINSTTWLIEYAKYLKITDLEFEEMVKVVKVNMDLSNDFFELANITIDNWEKIYYNAITVRGKNKLKHLYNMERQHVS